MTAKEIAKNNFSKYAAHYDRYSTVQGLCGLRLISKLTEGSFNRILEIGCGTGNYTNLLKDRFPAAGIKAVDISSAMIQIAKDKLRDGAVEFITRDAEDVDFNEQFDLISSNASFQWFADLEKALSKYEGLLAQGGVILFSAFGPRTFHELDRSLKALCGRGISIPSCNFAEKSKIEKIMKYLFKKVEVEEALYRENYKSLKELLEKIRYTGTRGNGAEKKGVWTPKMMGELENLYRTKTKDIQATYQIFFCKGVK